MRNNNNNNVEPGIIYHLQVKYGDGFLELLGDFEISKSLGEGSYGSTFLLENTELPNRVLKIQKVHKEDIHINESAINEIRILSLFSNSGITPEFFGSNTYSFYNDGYYNIYAYVIEAFDTTLNDFINRLNYSDSDELEQVAYDVFIGIQNIFDFMCKNNVVHGDFHIGNIGINVSEFNRNKIDKLFLFDFGFSQLKSCNKCFEIERFLWSLKWVGNETKRKKLEQVAEQLWDLYVCEPPINEVNLDAQVLGTYFYDEYIKDIHSEYPYIGEIYDETSVENSSSGEK